MSTANAQVKRSVGRPRLIQRIDPLPKLGILNNPSNDDNLVELSLEGNFLTSVPYTIGNLKNLELLNLDYNSNLKDLPQTTVSIIVTTPSMSLI